MLLLEEGGTSMPIEGHLVGILIPVKVNGSLHQWSPGCQPSVDTKREGRYDPKMDRKIFLPKLTDDSTEEACWMWRADTLALIEKGCSEKAIEVEMRKSLASCSRGLWFCEKHLLGYSLLRIIDEMKWSSPGEVGIQCDALLRVFYELSQQKREPIGKYSMHLDSAANKVCI